MISPEIALAFFSVALLLSASPGPDNLFVLMQSASGGRRAGFSVVIGLCLGLLLHTCAVALGLAAVFAASAMAFNVVKVAGCGYLLYLAWGAWRAPAQFGPLLADGSARRDSAPARPLLDGAMLLRGVLMNISNPKVVFFFLALLPQFTRADAGPLAAQIAGLGALFVLATLLVFGAVVLGADAIRTRLLRSATAQRRLNRASALVFVAMATKLALAQR